MKTSGIVALAIVVASMEVADAKCYIGYRSGFWQGTVNAAVQGGMVYIPTMTSKKIMIRGFRTSLTGGGTDDGLFYAGLRQQGVVLGIADVATGNGGTGGVNAQYIYLPFDATTGAHITSAINGEVTLDTANAGTAGGFTTGTSTVNDLHWLAIVKDDGSATYARFDFAPHFRGGWLTSMKYGLAGRATSEGSAETNVVTSGFSVAATVIQGSNEEIFGYFGLESWAQSRDQLDALVTPGTPTPNDNKFYQLLGVTGDDAKIRTGNLPQATIAIANIDGGGGKTVADIKWFALQDGRAEPNNGIAAYVVA